MANQLIPQFFLILALSVASCTAALSPSPAKFEVNDKEPIGAKPVEPKYNPKAEIAKDIENRDKTYLPNIHTVLLDQTEVENSLPIIQLGSSTTLFLQFDDLDNYLKQYSYRFIHCDANWQESILQEGEFLDGFSENYINNYAYSLNTKVGFVHYELEFPNRDVKLKKSGNYIIQVYQNNDIEDVVLTRRFFILDNKASAAVQVKRATLANDREEKQEVDFVIQTGDYQIDDPFSGLKVCLRQNKRWDNQVTDLKPIFIRNSEFDFNHDGPNTFFGANEFRYVDFRSLRFLGDQIQRIATEDTVDHVHLRLDPKRSFDVYTELRDINGDRVININEGFKATVEADYVFVHFYLPYSYEIDEAVYVFGGLSDWDLDERFKMTYNEEKSRYEAAILLKQGYYNYLYAIEGESGAADLTFFEGTHYQTENQYNLFIYNKAAGSRYDELIGFNSINSRNGF